MKLIVAEKPSLGRNIAAAIGGMTAKSGYMEGNGYIVSWAHNARYPIRKTGDRTPR